MKKQIILSITCATSVLSLALLNGQVVVANDELATSQVETSSSISETKTSQLSTSNLVNESMADPFEVDNLDSGTLTEDNTVAETTILESGTAGMEISDETVTGELKTKLDADVDTNTTIIIDEKEIISSKGTSDVDVDNVVKENQTPILEKEEDITEPLPSKEKEENFFSGPGKNNPIHLFLSPGGSKKYVRVTASIDWDPQYYSGALEIVDNKGRLMIKDDYFTISKLSAYESYIVDAYPDGVYTVLMRGETDMRDNYQKFSGKASFEVKNGEFLQSVATPANLRNINTSIDYVDVGVNPIHLIPTKSGTHYVRLYANIDWNPYEYSGKFNVYDSNNRLMKKEEEFYIDKLSTYSTFPVSNYPNGIYTIVMEGKTGPSNGNQIFRGKISFEVKNGQFFQTVITPTYTSGWIKDAKGYWYQNADGTYPKNTWKQVDNSWYYFNNSGYMLTGWQKINNKDYFFKPSGAMAKNEWIDHTYYIDGNGQWVPGKQLASPGWKKNNSGYWYQYADGTYPANAWKKIDNVWYHFDSSGYMAIGWKKIGDGTFFFKKNGAMAKDEWIDHTYYVDHNGRWVKGKQIVSPGIVSSSQGKTYQNADGTYAKNVWRKVNNHWYYFNNSGYAVTGWRTIDKVTYYFKADGTMAKNQWIDGKYYVDENGKWIKTR